MLNQPAIDPPGECVANIEMFRRLARAMGFDDEYWSLPLDEMLKRSYDWDAPALQGITLEQLKERGWMRLNVGAPDTRRPHAEGQFKTPSGKCEFAASAAAGGDFVVPVWRSGYEGMQPGTPVDAVPNYIASAETTQPADSGRYPLSLVSPKPHAFLNTQYGNEPTQQRRQGEQVIVIHPADAQARRIMLGDVGPSQLIHRLRQDSAHVDRDIALSDNGHDFLRKIEVVGSAIRVPVVPADEIACGVDSFEFLALDVQPLVSTCAGGNHHPVVHLGQLVDRYIDPESDVAEVPYSTVSRDALENRRYGLELGMVRGYTEAHQSIRDGQTLDDVYLYRQSRLEQRLRRVEAARAAAHHSDFQGIACRSQLGPGEVKHFSIRVRCVAHRPHLAEAVFRRPLDTAWPPVH